MTTRKTSWARAFAPGGLLVALILSAYSCGDSGQEPASGSPPGGPGTPAPATPPAPTPPPVIPPATTPPPSTPPPAMTPPPAPPPVVTPPPVAPPAPPPVAPPVTPPPGPPAMPPPAMPPPVMPPPVVMPPPANPPPAPPPVMPPPGNPNPPPGEPAACANPEATPALRLVTVATASRPIHLVGHPSEPDLILIAERGGAVRQLRLNPGSDMGTLSGPVVNVQTKQDGERGLLSIALHPDDPTRLFAFFIAANNDSVVQEFKRNPEGGMATAVGQPRYRAAHSAGNHQGGNIAFGPDKMLYFAIGDNGGEVPGGRDRSLDLNTEFGKLLRIDPTTGNAPMGNQRGRIFASGLRNPWRMSFDRKTGDLYIGDVGFQTEEINFLPPNRAGTNFGWSGGGAGAGAAAFSYGRSCVIGGYVYRGTKMPCMQGRYIWKDRLTGAGRSFVIQNGRAANAKTHSGLGGGGLYSFGEDGAGEVYMLFENGRVARIVE